MSSQKPDKDEKKRAENERIERGLKEALASMLSESKPKDVEAEPVPAKIPLLAEAIAVVKIDGQIKIISVPVTAQTEYAILHETNSGPIAAKFLHAEILTRTRKMGLTRAMTTAGMSIPHI